ncbi:helix-turn-helix transcriptional regulator [uncultured Winogradskyella sp.]|uniref:helix-turn-helix domain-containing protein n=1 Tax=uncultured Winogradskyella sp. TaxID=395353 RepID=UPI00261E364C|nr:helix-turn-helix transcriptional regulator [uncultured Winogradskyella sp.]
MPPKRGYPLVPSHYGDFLKQARLDKCLTRFEMGLELEVYESTIDKWERGVAEPNIKNKQNIIQFLGYDPIQIKQFRNHEYIKK